ncbi:MAG: PD40 domain-containing protein [Flavobacteriia bacterium]|nr:PD40 domain-containing protein [Flavobacteriia bacterium]OJX36219.1 MAG: hypothetical protein BGO87_07090 [Flavobacteriia bacterium 40-80]
MRFYLFAFSLLFALNAFSQGDSTITFFDKSAALLQLEQGKTLLNDNNYLKAIQTFRNAAAKDPYSWKPLFWLAKTHYKLNNFGYSLDYTKKAWAKDSVSIDKEIYLLFAESYHRLGELEQAISYYETCLRVFNKRDADALEIEKKYNQAVYASEAAMKPLFAEKKLVSGEVNSGHNDYGPVLSQDGKTLYFTSRRNNTTGGGQNPYDELFYEDIYVAKWNEEDKIWDSVTNLEILDRVNGNGFESMSWLSPDGLKAYITINNEAVDEKIETSSSDIFEINFSSKGKWNAPKTISAQGINSSGFDACATITADGNTMYFVSDRNLKKGSDIYMAQKNGKSWGLPIALSDTVNTAGNETTPYITPDGKYLFFSSDTHKGMGGYDIFVSKNLGSNNWTKPVNLGAAINSVNNDTHFQYYPALKLAMFASLVKAGLKSSMDIFEIDMKDFNLPE